jgi:hypothetical protein
MDVHPRRSRNWHHRGGDRSVVLRHANSWRIGGALSIPEDARCRKDSCTARGSIDFRRATQKVSHFGYDFELPWDDIDEQKDKTTGTIHVSAFRSGNAFWFSTFPPKNFVNLIMKESNLDTQGFRQLYGDEAFESDYNFHKKMLQTTPSEITPFVSRREAAGGMILLLLKATSMPKADSGIFSIRTAGFDGFQFEAPPGAPV